MARSATGRSRATSTTTSPTSKSTSRPTSPASTARTPKTPATATAAAAARSPSSTRSASRRRATSSTRAPASKAAWTHTPSALALIWLAVSLPLVAWDAGYVLLRPHSMPGGRFHAPLWKPYALYGTIDLVYGWKAFHGSNGFTGAQTWLNLIESAGYLVYLWLVFTRGTAGRAAAAAVAAKTKGKARSGASKGFWTDIPVLGELMKPRVVAGKAGAVAVLLGFACTVMTVSKTVLYMLNEACSGFDNTRHNDLQTLVFLYALPNGCWLVFPSILAYAFGQEILEGLEIASTRKA